MNKKPIFPLIHQFRKRKRCFSSNLVIIFIISFFVFCPVLDCWAGGSSTFRLSRTSSLEAARRRELCTQFLARFSSGTFNAGVSQQSRTRAVRPISASSNSIRGTLLGANARISGSVASFFSAGKNVNPGGSHPDRHRLALSTQRSNPLRAFSERSEVEISGQGFGQEVAVQKLQLNSVDNSKEIYQLLSLNKSLFNERPFYNSNKKFWDKYFNSTTSLVNQLPFNETNEKSSLTEKQILNKRLLVEQHYNLLGGG